MSIIALLIGLIVAAIVYFVASLFLPYTIAVLLALLVLVLVIFDGARGGRFWRP